MKPPRFPLDQYCGCPGGHHVRRYLPVPETPEEEALIKAYDDVYEHPDPVEVAEAIERFIATGATAENLAWAVQCTERTLDRLYG